MVENRHWLSLGSTGIITSWYGLSYKILTFRFVFHPTVVFTTLNQLHAFLTFNHVGGYEVNDMRERYHVTRGCCIQGTAAAADEFVICNLVSLFLR